MVAADDFNSDMLTQIEKDNIAFLQEQIDKISNLHSKVTNEEDMNAAYRAEIDRHPSAKLEQGDMDRYSGLIFSGLYDINNDGVPELILGENNIESSAFMDGTAVYVYIYDGASVRLVNSMHNCYTWDEPGNHGFYIYEDNDGYYIGIAASDEKYAPDAGSDNYANTFLYYLDSDYDWAMKHVFWGSGSDGNLSHSVFLFDGQSVPQEEFDEAFSNYTEVTECFFTDVELIFK